jgi:hypothetical protein
MDTRAAPPDRSVHPALRRALAIMKERLKTLVLDADGGGWSYVAVDTVLRGMLRSRIDVSILPRRLRSNRWSRRLLGPRYGHLSYVLDWREAFCAAPELDVEVCNVNNLVDYRRRREAIRRYPLVVVLHSATGDSMGLLKATAHWFEARRGTLAVFLGNEYNLLEDKVAFLRSVGAEFVCSQLPSQAASWLYGDCRPTRVLAMPHALNPMLYHPDQTVRRSLDIGFCGDAYPHDVGDTERTALIRFFQRHGADYGLVNEFRLNARMFRSDWARFLNICKGTIGGESGSYYLDHRGQIIARAKAYLKRHPRASFDEVFDRFFRSPPIEYVSGKCISSRHFEPIGTKTCQVLLEGDYNGILRPDEHYIRVNKDLSNVDEVIRRFKDEAYRAGMVERTYEYVMDQHTYRHRIQALIRTLRSESCSIEAPVPAG